MIGAALGLASSLGSTVAGAIGASKERKMRQKAGDLSQKGVGEIQRGKGYKADDALKFLGLTDKSNYDSMNPEAEGYSMDALKNLIARGSGKGLDVQSKQALSEAIGRSGAATNAARQAVLQEIQSKGQSGGGAELLGMLTGQQQNYGNLAGATGAASAAAEQRRLEANVLASRAGQQQQQLEQQKASAKDALQRFNVGARQGTLNLEQQTRQGAANAYQNAGSTLAGMAPQAGVPAYTIGQAVGSGLGAIGNFYNAATAPAPASPTYSPVQAPVDYSKKIDYGPGSLENQAGGAW